MTLRSLPVETRLHVSFQPHTEGDILSTLRFKTRDSAFIHLDCYNLQIEVPLDHEVEEQGWEGDSPDFFLKFKAQRY